MLNENGGTHDLESLRGKSRNELLISFSGVGDIRSLPRDNWTSYTVMEPQRPEQVIHFGGKDFTGCQITPFVDLDSAPGELRLPESFFNSITVAGGLWQLASYRLNSICDSDVMGNHNSHYSLPAGEEGMLAFTQKYGAVRTFRGYDHDITIYPHIEDSRVIKVVRRFGGGSELNYFSWEIAANLFYSLSQGLKRGGQLYLEEFIGPLGFDNQDRIEQVVTAAGLNIREIGNLSVRQSRSDAVKRNISVGGYGTPFYVIAERPFDDDSDFDDSVLPLPEADLEYA